MVLAEAETGEEEKGEVGCAGPGVRDSEGRRARSQGGREGLREHLDLESSCRTRISDTDTYIAFKFLLAYCC